VSIRAGAGAERVTNPYIDDTTRSNDSYDLFETFVTSLAKSISDRFGSSQALLGYDTNDNGFIDSENELFGFDGTTAGPSLNTTGLVSSRLMVLTSAGASVRMRFLAIPAGTVIWTVEVTPVISGGTTTSVATGVATGIGRAALYFTSNHNFQAAALGTASVDQLRVRITLTTFSGAFGAALFPGVLRYTASR
jgi:hypothetical protein